MNAVTSAYLARIWLDGQEHRAARPSRALPEPRRTASRASREGGRRRRLAVAAVIAVAACSWFVAQASAHVYWTTSSGAIARANADGSGVNQSFITGANGPTGVTVDGQHVYWSNGSGFSLGRANLDGSGVNQSFIVGPSNAAGLAVDDQHLYWAGYLSGAIGLANLDGSGINGNFITGASFPGGVALDGQHVYWTNFGGTIGRANLDGSGANQSFITGASSPYAVAIDGAHVYWTNLDANTIGRANLDGSGVNQSFITGAKSPTGVAVDGQHVYWANNTNSSVGRANLDGSGVNQSFITGIAAPFGLAVDPPRPKAQASPSSLELGSQAVNTVGPPQSISVTSSGTGDLHVGQARVTGANPDDFLLSSDGCSQSTLRTGTSCSLGVRLAPSTGGARAATLTVPSDDPASPLQVPLSGTGASPQADPPDTTITAGPTGTTHDPTPSFSFSSSKSGSAFQCRVDAGAFTACDSPDGLAPLADGPHTFAVRASLDGATDPTPASRSFTVRTAAVGVSGNTLTVTAAPGARDNLTVTRPTARTLRVTDLPAGAFTGSGVHAGAKCTRTGDATAVCSAAGVIQLSALAGDRADRVVSSTALPSSLSGGAGNDVLTGGSAADRLTGGSGVDSMTGMGGADTLLAHDLASDGSIACGDGTGDKAVADQLPKDPATIVKGCESVARG